MKNTKIGHFVDPFSKVAKSFAENFDAAFITKNLTVLDTLISDAKHAIAEENIASQAQIYYSIGTTYGDLESLAPERSSEETKNNQIYYLRKSISLIELDELCKPEYLPYVTGLKLNLYTNYANALDHIGRKIAAIEQYKKVLTIKTDFGMALGNLGITYFHYGILVSDPSHRDYLNHFAYDYLNKAIYSNDPSLYEAAKDIFKSTLNRYDSNYIKQVLSVPLTISQYTYANPEEYTYRRWTLDNQLFLNPLNDLPVAEFYFAADVLQLPNIITNIDDKPIFHGMFNQFKQEYGFARYQYYRSLEVPVDVHYADKDMYLLNLADYPQYSIRLEKLKSSFRILYSMLDKVAFFINSYFNLGIKERDVSFHTIWLKEKKGRNGYKYKNTLNPDENFALASLYWISKDFYQKLLDSPNPQAKHLSELRNALEHKYVKVYWEMLSAKPNKEFDDLALYVSESELKEQTLILLKLIREVIICLSLAVGIEEHKRNAILKNKAFIPQIDLEAYDDEWKV